MTITYKPDLKHILSLSGREEYKCMLYKILFVFVGTLLSSMTWALKAQVTLTSSPKIDSLHLSKDVKWLILHDIELLGNRITKPSIIYRELSIKVGDTLNLGKVDSLLDQNRNNVFNTNLFVSVRLDLVYQKPQHAILKIYLEERWYIFPGPIFELSDRNFNEWVRTYNADLNRTNYGMRISIENFRGRKEKLDAYAQFGFTKKFGFNYQIPYLNRKQVLGLGFNFVYGQNKSIAFRSDEHQLSFYESEGIAFERYMGSVSLNRRVGIFDYHSIYTGFQSKSVEDSLARNNPRYFLNGKNVQRHFYLGYQYTHDTRDNRNYPLHGDVLGVQIQQNGLGIFGDLLQTQVAADYSFFTDLGHRFYASNRVKGLLLIQKNQPYTNAQALGYRQDVLRGFELYVIDGQGFFLNQNTLRYQVFDIEKKAKFIPVRQFQTIPLALYFTLYADAGYVSDSNFTDFSSRFSNKFIYSWGAGVDFVSFYNLILRFNYAFNSGGEGAVYFKLSTSL